MGKGKANVVKNIKCNRKIRREEYLVTKWFGRPKQKNTVLALAFEFAILDLLLHARSDPSEFSEVKGNKSKRLQWKNKKSLRFLRRVTRLRMAFYFCHLRKKNPHSGSIPPLRPCPRPHSPLHALGPSLAINSNDRSQMNVNGILQKILAPIPGRTQFAFPAIH